MLDGKDIVAVDIVFIIIGTYIDQAAQFQNDASINGVPRVHFDIVSELMSQSYG